jgi:hypothetical protein
MIRLQAGIAISKLGDAEMLGAEICKEKPQLTAEMVCNFAKTYLPELSNCHLFRSGKAVEILERMCSNDKFVEFSAGRGEGKTSIQIAFVLAACLYGFKKFVLVSNGTLDESIQFCKAIRYQLLYNKKMIADFGCQKLLDDRAENIDVQSANGRFKISGIYTRKKLVGIKWNGKRPDLIILDDANHYGLSCAKYEDWVNKSLVRAGCQDCVFRESKTLN